MEIKTWTNHSQINKEIELFNQESIEEEPFRKVHRLIDILEVIIKTHTALAVANTLTQPEMDKDLKDYLIRMLQRPSLGTWSGLGRMLVYKHIIPDSLTSEEWEALDLDENREEKLEKYYKLKGGKHRLVLNLNKVDPYTYDDLGRNGYFAVTDEEGNKEYKFSSEFFLTGFYNYFLDWDQKVKNEHQLVSFRNKYAHGAVPANEECRADLKAKKPVVEKLLAADWLRETTVVVVDRKGQQVALEGYPPAEEFESREELAPETPYLINSEGAALKLFPVLKYEAKSDSKTEENNLLMFFNEYDRQDDQLDLLHYPWFNHLRGDEETCRDFREALDWERWEKERKKDEFMPRIEELSSVVVGREREKKYLEQFLSDKQRGYYFVFGNSGLGKSAFLAYSYNQLQQDKFNLESVGFEEFAFIIYLFAAPEYAKPGKFVTCLNNKLEEVNRTSLGQGNNLAEKRENLHKRLKKFGDSANKKVVIFIDGLDEAFRHQPKISSYLPTGFYDGVKIIYSGRPTVEVNNFYHALPLEAKDSLELDKLGAADIRAALLGVVSKYDEDLGRDSQLVDRIVAKSAGLPLYLKLLLRELKISKDVDEELPLEVVDDLPAGIEDLYGQKISELKGKPPFVLAALYIFGAARGGLGKKQLQIILDLEAQQAEEIIDDLQEFLTLLSPGEYLIFHESFRDYLEHHAGDNLTVAREKLAAYCRLVCREWKAEKKKSWQDTAVVTYPLRYYVDHLIELRQEQKLWELFREPIYRQPKKAISYLKAQINGLEGGEMRALESLRKGLSFYADKAEGLTRAERNNKLANLLLQTEKMLKKTQENIEQAFWAEGEEVVNRLEVLDQFDYLLVVCVFLRQRVHQLKTGAMNRERAESYLRTIVVNLEQRIENGLHICYWLNRMDARLWTFALLSVVEAEVEVEINWLLDKLKPGASLIGEDLLTTYLEESCRLIEKTRISLKQVLDHLLAVVELRAESETPGLLELGFDLDAYSIAAEEDTLRPVSHLLELLVRNKGPLQAKGIVKDSFHGRLREEVSILLAEELRRTGYCKSAWSLIEKVTAGNRRGDFSLASWAQAVKLRCAVNLEAANWEQETEEFLGAIRSLGGYQSLNLLKEMENFLIDMDKLEAADKLLTEAFALLGPDDLTLQLPHLVAEFKIRVQRAETGEEELEEILKKLLVVYHKMQTGQEMDNKLKAIVTEVIEAGAAEKLVKLSLKVTDKQYRTHIFMCCLPLLFEKDRPDLIAKIQEEVAELRAEGLEEKRAPEFEDIKSDKAPGVPAMGVEMLDQFAERPDYQSFLEQGDYSKALEALQGREAKAKIKGYSQIAVHLVGQESPQRAVRFLPELVQAEEEGLGSDYLVLVAPLIKRGLLAEVEALLDKFSSPVLRIEGWIEALVNCQSRNQYKRIYQQLISELEKQLPDLELVERLIEELALQGELEWGLEIIGLVDSEYEKPHQRREIINLLRTLLTNITLDKLEEVEGLLVQKLTEEKLVLRGRELTAALYLEADKLELAERLLKEIKQEAPADFDLRSVIEKLLEIEIDRCQSRREIKEVAERIENLDYNLEKAGLYAELTRQCSDLDFQEQADCYLEELARVKDTYSQGVHQSSREEARDQITVHEQLPLLLDLNLREEAYHKLHQLEVPYYKLYGYYLLLKDALKQRAKGKFIVGLELLKEEFNWEWEAERESMVEMITIKAREYQQKEELWLDLARQVKELNSEYLTDLMLDELEEIIALAAGEGDSQLLLEHKVRLYYACGAGERLEELVKTKEEAVSYGQILAEEQKQANINYDLLYKLIPAAREREYLAFWLALFLLSRQIANGETNNWQELIEANPQLELEFLLPEAEEEILADKSEADLKAILQKQIEEGKLDPEDLL